MSDSSFASPQRAHVIRLSANIGTQKGLLDEAELRAAMGPWVPFDDGLTIDLSRWSITDDNETYWKIFSEAIRQEISGYIHHRVAPTPVRQLCVFGFAPIPLLAVLGECLGEKLPTRVFNRFRSPSGWRWKDAVPPRSAWVPTRRAGSSRAQEIALLVSISGRIDPEEVDLVVPPTGRATYEIAIEDPRLDVIQSEQQLGEFSEQYRNFLAEVRNTHGLRCQIHIFAAVPVAIAIELGRCVLPKTDPAIRMYDHQRSSGYRFALELLPARQPMVEKSAAVTQTAVHLDGLKKLVLALFAPDEFQELIKLHFGADVGNSISMKASSETMVGETIEYLNRRGQLVNLIQHMRKNRPHREDEIAAVAKHFPSGRVP